MGEQIGRALDLVEDQVVSLREKAPRIRERPRPQIRRLERERERWSAKRACTKVVFPNCRGR